MLSPIPRTSHEPDLTLPTGRKPPRWWRLVAGLRRRCTRERLLKLLAWGPIVLGLFFAAFHAFENIHGKRALAQAKERVIANGGSLDWRDHIPAGPTERHDTVALIFRIAQDPLFQRLDDLGLPEIDRSADLFNNPETAQTMRFRTKLLPPHRPTSNAEAATRIMALTAARQELARELARAVNEPGWKFPVADRAGTPEEVLKHLSLPSISRTVSTWPEVVGLEIHAGNDDEAFLQLRALQIIGERLFEAHPSTLIEIVRLGHLSVYPDLCWEVCALDALSPDQLRTLARETPAPTSHENLARALQFERALFLEVFPGELPARSKDAWQEWLKPRGWQDQQLAYYLNTVEDRIAFDRGAESTRSFLDLRDEQAARAEKAFHGQLAATTFSFEAGIHAAAFDAEAAMLMSKITLLAEIHERETGSLPESLSVLGIKEKPSIGAIDLHRNKGKAYLRWSGLDEKPGTDDDLLWLLDPIPRVP